MEAKSLRPTSINSSASQVSDRNRSVSASGPEPQCSSRPAWQPNQLALPAKQKVPSNPSLERTSTGKPRWPLPVMVHHPSSGQRDFPAGAAQLKR